MKNSYAIIDGNVVIELQNGITTKVSAKHIDKLSAFPGKWTADKDYATGKHYVKNQTMTKGKNITTVLARFLLDAAPGTKVDHADGDTLNNLDDNLRAVSSAFNSQNQTLKSKNSKSGYRGITITRHGTYQPRPMANGKRYSLKTYKTIEEAVGVLKAFYDENGIPYIE